MLLFTFINLFLWTQITFGQTLPNPLSQTDIDALLNAHNSVRSEVAKGNRLGHQPTSGPTYTLPKATDMIRIEWDEALAKVASDYAATCPTGHSAKASRKQAFSDAINNDCLSNIDYNGNDGIGENMGWTSQNPSSISILTGSLDSMNDESDWYQYGNKFGDSTNNYYESLTPPQTAPYPNANDFCLYPDSTNGGSCGHFTQNIWASTRYVGCGFAQCNYPGYTTGTRLVCNYYDAGNYAEQAVYTEGTTSCSNCPAGSTCDSDKLCTYPPSPAPACKPTAPPTAVTPSPVTAAPTAVTPSPVTPAPSVTPEYAPCMKILNMDNNGGFFDYNIYGGVWSRVTDWNGKPSYFLSLFGYQVYMDWDDIDSQYEIHSAPQGPANWIPIAKCGQSNINLCTAGQWSDPTGPDTDATFIPTPCPSPALITDKNEHSISLQSDNNNNNNNNVEVFNVTEMHIILCLLIVVVILMCVMVMVGFCYYIKNKNKNGNTSNNGNNDKMEMMYFESQDNIKQRGTPSRGTPIGTDNKNTNNMNQQQLSISITDKKLMKKIQSTTPVTPLIEDEQYDGM